MSGKQETGTDKLNIRHPLIKQIDSLTTLLTDSCLTIVYPEASGWKQTHSEQEAHLTPAFCKLIQSTPEGARHCRMCHILMTVAACSGGATEQCCHAGARVLVCSASPSNDESMAVLSSCLFSSDERWEEIRQRGQKLGINLTRLREAFMNLPHMDTQQIDALKAAMQTMGYALQVVRENQQLSARIDKLGHTTDQIETLEKFLADSAWANPAPKGVSAGKKDKPLLIHVVCELIQQRPDLPLTVKEIAAAARLTPNHFTTLFSEHVGKPFNEYLTEQRMKRARKLLGNPTLGISEIARLCGYDDPGYFARRFHKTVGVSPREWRNHPDA